MTTVAEICARLDGLPLAIELAAARLNVFSPSELLERLGNRLDLIGGGSRDLPERQRTLHNTIDWSYDLLDEVERQVFELMSLFTTAQLITVESVAKALDLPDPLGPLASLVDKSLVRSEESGETRRFSMLRTIREYASSRLAEDPPREAAARRAHAEVFTALAHELRSGLSGSQRQRTLAQLEADNGNLRSAWHHWVGIGDLENLYLLLDGLWALLDAKGWYHTAIELAGDLLHLISTKEPSSELAAEEMTLRTSLARALMAVYGWGPEVEETFHRIAADLEEVEASAVQRFPVLRALSSYYLNLTRFEMGAEIGRQILELAAAEGDPAMEIEGLVVSGTSRMFMGNLAEGLAMLDETIARFDPSIHGSSRYRLGPSPGVVAGFAAGLTRWQMGELERARVHVTEALDLARSLGHPISLAYALYHFGFFSFNSHHFDATRTCAAELAAVARKNEYPIWQALAEVLDGVALTGLGHTEEGFKKTETGIVLYQSLSTPPVFWPMILGLRAISMAAAGDPVRALSLVEEAIELSGGIESGANLELAIFRGDILGLLPDPDVDRIAESYELAAGTAEQVGFRTTHLQALNRLVQLNRSIGRDPDGAEELLAIYGTFTDGLDELDLAIARDLLGLTAT